MANNTKAIIIIAILAIIIGWLGSKLIDSNNKVAHYQVEVISYQCQIDSIQTEIDTAMARLDREYVKNAKVIIRNRIEYITQNTENEKQVYFLLPTTDRVAYFHKWVRERSKRNTINGGNIEFDEDGVDEQLHN